jgi:hypothetical protein
MTGVVGKSVIERSRNDRGDSVNIDGVSTNRRGGVSPPRFLDRRNGRGGHTPPLQYAMLDDVIKCWILYDNFLDCFASLAMT